MDTIKKFSDNLGVKIAICFLLLLQLFPPLWVQDVTSLRHFLIALFDVGAGSIVAFAILRNKSSIHNPIHFKPLFIFLLLLIWMAISMIWAINRVESIAVLNRWIVVYLSACITGIFLSDNERLIDLLVYCTIIISLVNVLTCIIGYYYFDLHISQRRNLMLNGGYGNKNIFAVCLLFKLPFLYYTVVSSKKWLKAIALLLIAAICFCLIILSTRSTFIGLFIQIIFILAFMICEKVKRKSPNKDIILYSAIVVCCIAGVFLGNTFIKYNYNKYASHNVTNNYTVSARVKTIEDGNSKGRLIIWHNTLEIIRQRPLLGYGIGNHKINIMRVEAKKKTNYVVSDHAHNDFLEMQSELGIIGELLYVLMYLSMGISGLKIILSKHSAEKKYRLIALIALLTIVTYMNDAMFNFPNERATPQMYLGLSFALMMCAYDKVFGHNNKIILKKTTVILLSILIIGTFYIETNHFISSIIQRQRILCYNRHNNTHIPPVHWCNIAPWLPNIDESTKPIALNNAMMYALEGDYRTATNLVLNDNSNPFYGLKEYRLASYYAHMGMIDSSNYWADSCIKVKPLCYDAVRVKVSNAKFKHDTAFAEKIIMDYINRESSDERAWIDWLNIALARKDSATCVKIYSKALDNNITSSGLTAKKHEIEALNSAY